MKLTSKLAVIFGGCLLLVAIGTANNLGICAAALLLGFGTAGAIETDNRSAHKKAAQLVRQSSGAMKKTLIK
jgi:hypothetical protein